MSLLPFITYERSLLCANSAHSASLVILFFLYPLERTRKVDRRFDFSPSAFKLSTFNPLPHLYRHRNAAKMNNSGTPNGHAV